MAFVSPRIAVGMRVVHIITRMIIGGAQENTLYNCLDLVRDFGDEVILLTGEESGPEGGLLEQGRGGGVRVIPQPFLRRNISLGADVRAYRELVATLRRLKPDVVHTHSAKGGLLGRAAAWRAKVPAVIHTVHGAPFHAYQSFLARRLFIACERWGARRCHHMISVADAMTELMVRARVAPRSQFTTIYSGMEVETFVGASEHRERMRRRLGFAEGDVVVGKIARLFHLKGHEYLLEAAKEVVVKFPQVRFVLVGDGILRGELEAKLARYGLEGRFHLAGLVPPEEIPAWIGAMDILVHTSLREGLARTLPQALLAGVPVISYDIDGAGEVVRDGETGYLLPPKDVAGLAVAIGRLAGDATLRRRMGMAGRKLCLERFDHRVMTAQIRAIYERFLAR